MPKTPRKNLDSKIQELEKRLEKYKNRVMAAPPQPQPQCFRAQTPELEIIETDPEAPELEADPETMDSEPINGDENDSEGLDPEMLLALGEPTSGERLYGEKVNEQIYMTIKNILIEGLPKQNKEKIMESLLVPSNCKLLDAPKLNLQLLGLLNNPSKTRDKLLQERQQEMGLALANICQVIQQLSRKDFDKMNIVKKLSDTSRVLSNLHFQYTEIRRRLISPYLDKNLTESLKENKRDEYLYANLDDSLKSFSAIKRASSVLKPKGNMQAKTLQSKNFQAPPRRPIPNQAHPPRGSFRGGTQHRYQPRHPYKPQENRHAGPSLRGRANQPRPNPNSPPKTAYDFTVKDINGKEVRLEKYKGYVSIIVNVASQCGYTDNHYKQLSELYEKYASRGLRILAFPCNQFGGQEPGSPRDILAFAKNRSVKFDLFEKVEVNGDNAHPLWKFLKEALGESAISPETAQAMCRSTSTIFSIVVDSINGEVILFSTAKTTPSEVQIPMAVEPSLMASMAYSTWNSLPSGLKVFTPRSYSDRVRNI
ncbi:hypothetical protein MSG28_012710 [Choristoneura fumiferana]|uniref:Uncharacterized protein n=1 Tax=Choristoneura fumiferana TaxID=7141 RepID=A0ACC0JHS7_CHOFU|nr:hypothetical protein MSG28_012710 [Choristoneura fumiferana]